MGAWHHVAYTFSTSTDSLRIYIDGVQQASNEFTGSITYNSLTFFLGEEVINYFDTWMNYTYTIGG